MRERKEDVRFPLVTNVEYNFLKHPDIKGRCLSVNFGGGGMKLCLGEKPKIGERLNISFAIPTDSVPISAESTVIWAARKTKGKVEAGIKFTRINEYDKEKISLYIKRCLTWD